MRSKTVEIKMINGDTWYVPKEEFNSFNVPESPESILGSFIRGSRGPLIKVNAMADMSGEYKHINASFILDVKVTYN